MDRFDAGPALAVHDTVSPARQPHLRIVVPYTTPELTQAALRSVALWTQNLEATVRLIGVHIVPYPCPLEKPDVDPDCLRNRLAAAAEGSAIPLQVQVVLARDTTEALRLLLVPETVIVLPTRRRWWRTAEERLARSLARAGHQVALVTV